MNYASVISVLIAENTIEVIQIALLGASSSTVKGPGYDPIAWVFYFGWLDTGIDGVVDLRVFHTEDVCVTHLEEGIGAPCIILRVECYSITILYV